MTYEELNKIYINAMKSKLPNLVNLTKAIKNTVMQAKNSPDFSPSFEIVEKAIETTSNPDVISVSENNIAVMETWLPKPLSNDELVTIITDIIKNIPENTTNKPNNIYSFLYVKNIMEQNSEFVGKYEVSDIKAITENLLKS